MESKKNDSSNLHDFESRVLKNLSDLNLDLDSAPIRIGLAVSGGADSVSLLLSVAEIFKQYEKPFWVITINHRIRSESESSGDAKFVFDLCEKLKSNGSRLELFTKNLPENEVKVVSENRKCGTEEAARFLRYNAFLEFKEMFSLDYVFLAHTKNDNLETILMRFLQGSSKSGIKKTRDFYVRPLLDFERSEIESYLNEKNQEWKTDSTNSDENYLRNRIRKNLVPLLDEKFNGWKKALLSGEEKAFFDEEFFEGEVKKVLPKIKNENEIIYDKKMFKSLSNSVLLRVLYNSFNLLKIEERISFSLCREFLEKIKTSEKFECSSKSVKFGFDKNLVFVKKAQNLATESSFFAIIEDIGEFEFPFGTLNVKKDAENKVLLEFENFSFTIEKFPFIVRSRQKNDKILAANGFFKNVSDILSDWHVSPEDKDLIPLVQSLFECETKIIALLGSVKGYKNWILKNVF